MSNQWVEAETDILARKTVIEAPIHLVAAELSAILKPDRKLISAIKVAGGKIKEVTRIDLGAAALPKAVATAKAATTVAKPVRGCPATDFDQAELRARDVLRAFLSPEQLEDFELHQKFVAVGADTGHRYMITSRHARDEIACYQRSFYDLDEQRPLCAHDWAVPAAEEMLALLVCVTTPGNETMLRELRPH